MADALGLVGSFAVFMPRIRLEERALEERFGEPYRASTGGAAGLLYFCSVSRT